jgi:hypothetical protein
MHQVSLTGYTACITASMASLDDVYQNVRISLDDKGLIRLRFPILAIQSPEHSVARLARRPL